MAFRRNPISRLVIGPLSRPVLRSVPFLRAGSPLTQSTRSLASQSTEVFPELFEYTSGRWTFVLPHLLILTLVADCGLELE